MLRRQRGPLKGHPGADGWEETSWSLWSSSCQLNATEEGPQVTPAEPREETSHCCGTKSLNVSLDSQHTRDGQSLVKSCAQGCQWLGRQACFTSEQSLFHYPEKASDKEIKGPWSLEDRPVCNEMAKTQGHRWI